MQILRILIIPALISPAVCPRSSLERQVRRIVRSATPGIPAGHFPWKPKMIQRFGPGHLRIDEQSNPDHELKVLVTSNAPTPG